MGLFSVVRDVGARLFVVSQAKSDQSAPFGEIAYRIEIEYIYFTFVKTYLDNIRSRMTIGLEDAAIELREYTWLLTPDSVPAVKASGDPGIFLRGTFSVYVCTRDMIDSNIVVF